MADDYEKKKCRLILRIVACNEVTRDRMKIFARTIGNAYRGKLHFDDNTYSQNKFVGVKTRARVDL